MKKHTERIEGFTRNFNEALTSLYDQGYADASKDIDAKVDDAYERGCDETVTKVWEAGFDDGWDAAFQEANKFILRFYSINADERKKIFGDYTLTVLLETHDLIDLYKTYKKWVDEHVVNPEFIVGDIVSVWDFGKAVILHIFKDKDGADQFLLYNGTTTNVVTKNRITKVGHSDSVTGMYRDIVKAEDTDNLPF